MKKIGEKNYVNSTFNKASNDETLFILRAQDITAPLAILKWIEVNFLNCSEVKLMDAFNCALKMKEYPNRKQAD